MTTLFPEIRFEGRLRPSQSEVREIAARQLGSGERRLHIVAPPGSGKTVIGLFIWSQLVRRPAVVLSPNSAIQAQWASRTNLFSLADGGSFAENVSTDPQQPGLLTSLTYQSVTLPMRATAELDQRALELWQQTLVEENRAESVLAAGVWIEDLKTHNESFFKDRLSFYRGKIREVAATEGNAIDWLHDSSRETLERLRNAKVSTLILDECHHLMGHWGRVLADVENYLEDPVIIGLTATPPDRDGKSEKDIERYDTFFGPIDYEVPVPAVVKDGFLAPYQDLAYMVRPTAEELAFIAQVDKQFHDLIDELCLPRKSSESEDLPPRESLIDWIARVLADKQLPARKAGSWSQFQTADPQFAACAVRFLCHRGEVLPADIPRQVDAAFDELDVVVLVDRYTRHCLRRSPHSEDHQLANQAIDRLRMLGVQITDKGSRACASPVSRVISYTKNKTQAVVPILSEEMDCLGDSIRAVVIADYEKTSAISSEISHLLDDEAGGAIAAFRAILNSPKTNQLDPVLLTGATVLADADLVQQLLAAAVAWLAKRGFQVHLTEKTVGNFSVVSGRGGDWCPRVYVELFTDMFQRGVTRCLVGTRGLLGEGWDANTINVLVDLSTVTTSMTVNQLRGRSIRLDPNAPKKLANNWDVVCIAPEFTKGLDDYKRLIRKHKTIFGICDDGAIEKGIGHVHAAFTELKPELLEGSVNVLNADMLARAHRREQVYKQWQIGQPYDGKPTKTIEYRSEPSLGFGMPPLGKAKEPWNENSLAQAIGKVILSSMRDLKLIKESGPLKVSQRAGGFLRVFLERASEDDTERFVSAFQQAVGPVQGSRYVIPRNVNVPIESLLTRLLPSVIGQYFQKHEQKMAMLHAVPDELATNKSRVKVYQKYWNQLVSPGDAVYSKNELGQSMIKRAIEEGHAPTATIHTKEVFE